MIKNDKIVATIEEELYAKNKDKDFPIRLRKYRCIQKLHKNFPMTDQFQSETHQSNRPISCAGKEKRFFM